MQQNATKDNRGPQVDAIRRHAEAACVGNIEIADGTGLSPSAVSRTLRGHNRKPATIRKIRNYLMQIDPNPDIQTHEPDALQTRERNHE